MGDEEEGEEEDSPWGVLRRSLSLGQKGGKQQCIRLLIERAYLFLIPYSKEGKMHKGNAGSGRTLGS